LKLTTIAHNCCVTVLASRASAYFLPLFDLQESK
jgi:hypothetical protein